MANAADRGDRSQLVDSDGLIQSPDEQNSRDVTPLHMDSSQQRSTKSPQGFRAVVIGCICFAVCVTAALIMTIYLGKPMLTPHGGVVSDVMECSVLGEEMLKKGGSAVDAGVTTALCLGVFRPQYAGLGGGGMAVIRFNKNNVTETYDFMSAAPEGLHAPVDGTGGGLMVGVPGLLRGLKKLHEKYGRLKWKDVVWPVVNLTDFGVQMSSELVQDTQRLQDNNPSSPVYKYFQSVIPDDPKSNVKTMNLKSLNTLLRAVAEDGDKVLYESGTFSSNLIRTVSGARGIMTVDDLVNYKVEDRSTISTQFLGTNIDTVGAPTAGAALLLMLNVIQNLTSTHHINFTTSSNSDLLHVILEAAKFSLPHIPLLQDPTFNSSVTDLVQFIISDWYGSDISSRVELSSTYKNADLYSVYMNHTARPRLSPLPATMGSSHLSIIGPQEDMLSLTMSLNGWFGSGLVTDNGIILNNQMINFNQQKVLKRGERPVTPLAPVVLYNPTRGCSPRYSLGGTPGLPAIQGVAEVISNLIGRQVNLTDAVSNPRLYFMPTDNCVLPDDGIVGEALDDLKSRGHVLCSRSNQSSPIIVHSVVKIDQTVSGEADKRIKGAGAAVY